MRHILFLIIFIFLLNKAEAQNYFNNNYEFANATSNATTIIETNDGYVFPSCIYSSLYNSFLITKIDFNGDTLWTKEYQDSLNSYSTGASNSIINTYDSNLVFCGSKLDSSNNRDAWLVKLNVNGDTIWSKSYGGPLFDVANVVCQTADSGFVLMGQTKSFSMGSNADFYLIKTDKNGYQQWQKVFGGTAEESSISGQITLDGGFILSGKGFNVFYIVKTDSAGNFQWQQTYPGTIGTCFIKQVADSSYVLTGAKSVSGFGYQACIQKVNKFGAAVWQKNYGGTSDDWFYTQPIILNDKSILVAGRTMLGGIPIGMLIKTDSLGNQLWQRTYYKNLFGDNYFYDIKSTADNGFIMSGFCLVATSDPWVVKVDEFGCEVSNCNVGVNEFQISENNLILYPNPAENIINVQISDLVISDLKVEVLNVLGEVLQVNLTGSALDISHLAKGVYFITVTSKYGKRWTEKFVKN